MKYLEMDFILIILKSLKIKDITLENGFGYILLLLLFFLSKLIFSFLRLFPSWNSIFFFSDDLYRICNYSHSWLFHLHSKCEFIMLPCQPLFSTHNFAIWILIVFVLFFLPDVLHYLRCFTISSLQIWYLERRDSCASMHHIVENYS